MKITAIKQVHAVNPVCNDLTQPTALDAIAYAKYGKTYHELSSFGMEQADVMDEMDRLSEKYANSILPLSPAWKNRVALKIIDDAMWPAQVGWSISMQEAIEHLHAHMSEILCAITEHSALVAVANLANDIIFEGAQGLDLCKSQFEEALDNLAQVMQRNGEHE